MRKSVLRPMFFALGISAVALPSFVQGQTSGGAGGSAAGSGSTMGGSSTRPSAGETGSTGTGMSGATSGETGSMGSAGSTGMKGSATMTDQGMTEADRTLNSKLHQSLASDASLKDSAKNVHFNTDNGEVTLRGTVPTEKAKQDIEEKVGKMSGVKEVNNQLQIAPSTSGMSDDTDATDSLASKQQQNMHEHEDR